MDRCEDMPTGAASSGVKVLSTWKLPYRSPQSLNHKKPCSLLSNSVHSGVTPRPWATSTPQPEDHKCTPHPMATGRMVAPAAVEGASQVKYVPVHRPAPVAHGRRSGRGRGSCGRNSGVGAQDLQYLTPIHKVIKATWQPYM